MVLGEAVVSVSRESVWCGLFVAAVLALSLMHTPGKALADGVTKLSGGPGSVTINGRPAPEGTRITAEVRPDPKHIYAHSTSVDSDGSWSIEVKQPGPIQIVVDCFKADHEPLEALPEGREYRNVRLVAGVESDPRPVFLCFRGEPGSVSYNGLPVGPETIIEIRASNAEASQVMYYPYRGWSAVVLPSLRNITFWVDGLPAALPAFTPDPADAPFRFRLAVETRTPLPSAPPEHLWDIVLGATYESPSAELEPDNPLPTHTFSGNGLPDGEIRAILPPEILQPDVGRVIATAPIVGGAWSMTIPRTSARVVVFETGQGRDLSRSGRFAVHDHANTNVPTTAFESARGQFQILYGRGFPNGNISVVDVDCQSRTSEIAVTDGDWYIALDPNAFRRYVVEFGYSPVFVYTDPFSKQPGQLTEVRAQDFQHRSCEDAAGGVRTDVEQPLEMGGGFEETSSINVYIIARRLDDSRIEFGLRQDGSSSNLFPQRRFLKANAAANRWARSSAVSIASGLGGWIVARQLENGQIEFGLVSFSDEQTRILPARRKLSVDAEIGQWKRSSVITVEP